jgi:hypothetical protein
MFGFGHSGSAPEPFDALNGPRLAGPEGSHPLRSVRAEELVRSSDEWVRGAITLDKPAVVGIGITGMVRLNAVKAFEARGAGLRLAGLRLDETRQHREQHDSQGRVTSREDWVEARGRIFDDQTFVEPMVPASLGAGEAWESRFMVPAPPLGPPSAHLGESIVAWALEVHWDVAWGSDIRLATLLPLGQNRDLMAAGVGRQGGQSLMQEITVDGASIVVTSDLPAPAGSLLRLRVTWPGAPDGRGGRVELHRMSNAPNGEAGILASEQVEVAALRAGAEVSLTVPGWAPPSFDGAGLENHYVIRVLVDRRLRADAAIERPVGVI